MNHSPIAHFSPTVSENVRVRITRSVRVDPNGCWSWANGLDRYGYGRFSVRTSPGHVRRTGAHRAAWLAFVGDIPDGLHVDHLCRNRACANPEHMELVTPAENRARGAAPLSNRAMFDLPQRMRRGRYRKAAREFCKHGHNWAENEKVRIDRNDYIHRSCGKCATERGRAHRAKRASEGV